MIELQAPSQIMNFDETVLGYRDGAVTWAHGEPVKAPGMQFNIICNVQPLNGRDLLLVPEGDRYKEQYYLFSEKSEQNLLVNDRIIRNDVTFQAQSVEDWGTYYRARVVRIDVGPDANP